MGISERIKDHFAGIVTHTISRKEQTAYNLLVRNIRSNTRSMLKREARKINVELDS